MKIKETSRRGFLKGMATLMASPLVSKLDSLNIEPTKDTLSVDGVERMRITSSGYAVIGVTSPNTNLFINR